MSNDVVQNESLLDNEKVVLDILRFLDASDTCVVSQTCKFVNKCTKLKKPKKIILLDGGFKYQPQENVVLKVTDDGCFTEIRLDTLEFTFNKPIYCGKTLIYSEVWITECRDDIENKKEHLWKFPDLPRESLRETTEERLGHLLLRSERFIGKSYPWFLVHNPQSLSGMLELYSKILDLISPLDEPKFAEK